ncbi:MAG: hypothetical protein BroJett025_09110 [Patescibacteria group bacterium]|nr:MAG: hypothetical protein BroJett025_09110 [Patescibacteria group bacterium]
MLKGSHLEEITKNKKEAQKEVAQILTRQIQFDWANPKDFWIGYDRKSLVDLVAQIAIEIGITNEQAKKISVVFADCKPKPTGQVAIATAFPHFDILANGIHQLSRCTIIINRSRKAFNMQLENQQKRKTTAKQSSPRIPYSGNLSCRMDSTREFLLWMLTEELYHAKLFCMAKTIENDAAVNQRYINTRKKKGVIFSDVYENSYQEMTVARNCLLLLAKFIPQKAIYFKRIYQESLKTGSRPSPSIPPDVLKAMYIPTGFSLKTLIDLYFR